MARAADAPGSPDTEQDARSTRRVVGVLVVAVIAFAVQQTAIVPAIHDVQTSLGASQEWASWLVTVYLMVATVATPAMGRLGDLHGRKRMLLVGLAVFAVGSVGAALAPDIEALLLFRGVQGVGGAVYPLTLALARENVPERMSTRVIAVLTGAFGVGTALGFVAGGLLAEYVSWRGVFALGAVLVVAAGVAVARAVPESDEHASGGYDGRGTVTLGLSSITVLAGLTFAVSLGWTSPATIALLVVSAVSLGLWVRHERRADDPLIDVHVLTIRPVAVANLATVGLGWALFSSYLLIPEFARTGPGAGYGLGAGSVEVGLLLLPLAAAQTVCSTAAGFASRIPARVVFAAGLLLVAGGSGLLSVVQHSLAGVAAGALLLGMGAGLALEAGSATVTEAVAGDVAAVSAAVNSTVRRLAGGLGGQTSTLLLASIAVSGHPRFAAFRTAYLVGAGLCVLGGLVVVGARHGD